MNTIRLSQPILDQGLTVKQAMMRRHSTREFFSKPLSLDTLSEVFWAAYGVNRTEGKRTVPSALGLYPLEIYGFTAQGVYKYNPEQHTLTKITDKDLRAKSGSQEFVAGAPLDLVIYTDYKKFVTGNPDIDNMVKGQEDRISLLDAGAVTENIYLYCSSEQINVVERAMVDEKALSEALGLSSSRHFIVAMSIGYPPIPA
jgi:SagB-type dehydrogenase family enzyme